MAGKRNPKAEEAMKLYESGMKLVDIAKKLGVPEGTVRRWKSTYKWDKGKSSKKKQSERSERNASVRMKKNGAGVQMDAFSDYEEVENSGLNDKQRLFCLYYVRCFNATKAYQKAYGVSYETAAAISYRLLEKDGIRKEITRLKKNRINRELLTEDDLFQKYMDIAFADITDYISSGKDNELEIKDFSQIDGTIVSEIKQGRNGTSIKLADRMRALQWLHEHIQLATDEQAKAIEDMSSKDSAEIFGISIYLPEKEE